MEEIAKNLAGVFYIATAEGDQPHVRPFDGAYAEDGKLYIGTASGKDVYKQILANPKVEIFTMEDGQMTRFMAEAYPVADEAENERLYEKIGKEYKAGAATLELKELHGGTIGA